MLKWLPSRSPGKRPFSRKSYMTSPLPFVPTHTLSTKQCGDDRTSSEGEVSSSSSSSSSSTYSIREPEWRGESSAPTVGNARKNWKGSGKGVARGSERWNGSRHEAASPRDHPSSSLNQRVMLDSLHSINSQLGELLSRVGSAPAPQPQASSFSNGRPSLSESSIRYSDVYVHPVHFTTSIAVVLGGQTQ